jgi:hypothetical protein
MSGLGVCRPHNSGGRAPERIGHRSARGHTSTGQRRAQCRSGRGPLVSPRAADGSVARVIREPVRATPTSPAALLLPYGHRTAASRGKTNGRTAPTQAVPWHDRFHHSGIVAPAMPMPRAQQSRRARQDDCIARTMR